MKLSDLYPDLVLYVPGCPDPTMERALRDAAREFCRETYAITETTDAITTVANEATVELTELATAQKEIVAALSTYVDGVMIQSIPRDSLRVRVPNYPSSDTGKPLVAYSEGEVRMRLYPVPDDAYDVIFEVATAPTARATQIDDDLGNRWKHAVIGRAVSILCQQPGTSYYDPTLAAAQYRFFMDGRNKARIERNRSFGRATFVTQRGSVWV